MGVRKVLIPAILAAALSTFACVYVVLPEGLADTSAGAGTVDAGWTGIATSVGESDPGVLHIDLTIRNDTGRWSTMRAADERPAKLTLTDGTTKDCKTVMVGTGGHRLAPGFQVRGITRLEGGEPVTQLIQVECEGAAVAAGSTLTIEYFYFLGEVDYYVEIEETNRERGTMEVNLDEVVTDLTYPVGTPIDGVIQPADTEITALSDNIVKLVDLQRDEAGIRFTWENYNPFKFALKTHIGIPPVVGEDGIIYGTYETLDIPPVPLTPALEKIEWTTEAPVPADVGGLYVLLSVESKKPRTYVNYALDITDK
jgi:hypothetical protein